MSAAVSRDLPIPASPESNTTWPSPVFAFDQRRSSNSSSSSRPTSSVNPLACRASKRLSTELGRNAAQARTGPLMPLRSLCAEVLKLEEIAEELSRTLGDDHRVRLGDALQSCCEVRRLADDAALLRLPRSDQIADHDQPGGNAHAGLQGSAGLQRADRLRSAPALPAPPARHHPHAPADSRNTRAPRRPCTSLRTRRSGARSRRRTSDRRK